ncbi:MAG TPA: metallophosphoesterase [Solirubrobacterales bacterium]|nr:metallophosphoesterase [Solirubrobacterales bacterium]
MGNGNAGETQTAATFRFVHLSDIHFAGYGPGVVFDVNSDIRRELVHDLHGLVARAGNLDAILIGGDIAGGGREEEYEAATRWIEQLCDEFDIQPEMVFCVPGNHDVYRPAIESNSVLKVAQRTLLNCSLEELDPLLEALFTNKEHPGLLLQGLAHYNEFAARYRCEMDLYKHRWEWNLEFGDLKIHLVGLASAILCGPDDVKRADQSRLALGPQARFPRFVDGTFTIMLSHHPPNWLRDYDVIAAFLDRAHLQLYGHEHSFDSKASGEGIRVDAGAVHPSRKEDPWQPSYNVISLSRGETGPEVTVDIYPRRLLENQTFGAMEEGEDFRRETVSLGYEPLGDSPSVPVAAAPEADSIEERQIARQFLDLDRDTRLRIGRELELIGEAEEALPEGVRMRHVFDRARAENRLPDLKEKIDD